MESKKTTICTRQPVFYCSQRVFSEAPCLRKLIIVTEVIVKAYSLLIKELYYICALQIKYDVI